MKAAVLYEPGTPFVIEDLDLEGPSAGEVRVKIAATGVCRSDHHLVTGTTSHPMPVVCGHEGSGVVTDVGDGVTRVRPGDHVVLSWAPSCGNCYYCMHELPAQCEAYLKPIWDGTLMDGTTRLSLAPNGKNGRRPVHHFCSLATFAEAAVVHESACVPVRKDVSLDVAALVGCAVATGVSAVRVRAKVKPGSSVAVFGCGGVGLNIVQAAALSGAERVIAIDIAPAKLDLAMRVGGTDRVDAAKQDPVEAVRALTQGRGADYVFEAIGRTTVMTQAVEAARRGGMVVLVGLGPRTENLALSAGTFTRSDKLITGAYYGGCTPARDFPAILDLYKAGELKLDDFVTRRRPLAQINEAFADMLAGDTVRTLITF